MRAVDLPSAKELWRMGTADRERRCRNLCSGVRISNFERIVGIGKRARYGDSRTGGTIV